jgi:hypothetical protein
VNDSASGQFIKTDLNHFATNAGCPPGLRGVLLAVQEGIGKSTPAPRPFHPEGTPMKTKTTKFACRARPSQALSATVLAATLLASSAHPQLALTAAGLGRGFALTTFATNFPNGACCPGQANAGPVGIAFPQYLGDGQSGHGQGSRCLRDGCPLLPT